MRLIVNADDFGLTLGVSEGIIKGIKEGIVTDTTVMVNMESFEESIKLLKENNISEAGLHLNLTCGKSIVNKEEVSTIVDENGYFFRKPNLFRDDMKIEEIEKELRAQIEKFKSSGLRLNHIDAHHHFYIFFDDILDLAIKLAKEEGVPMRCPSEEKRNKVIKEGVICPDYFEKTFFDDIISEEYLIERLDYLKDEYDVVEFMVHPAIVDEELKELSSYTYLREKELEILTSNKIKNYLKENNILKCSYDVLNR